jgi:hypothetical protein
MPYEEPPRTSSTCPPRKRSPRPTLSGKKKPGVAEAQRLLWQDPAHRAKMSAARRRTAEARRENPHLYSRIGVPDGMRKAEAMKAWDEAHSAANEYIATLETKGIVGITTVLDTDEGKAKAALQGARLQDTARLHQDASRGPARDRPHCRRTARAGAGAWRPRRWRRRAHRRHQQLGCQHRST